MNALYIHIPFCVKKCLFCSFAVSVGAGHRAAEYCGALRREMRSHRGRRVDTVYLGGGTPTFLDEALLAQLAGAVRENFRVSADAAWSIEANPEGMDVKKARGLKALGFGRVSLGVQTFNEGYLKFLGRAHDSAQAQGAYACLREAGVADINVDLMYGFPGQTRRELEDDLERISLMVPEHVSIYTLTVEPNSRFFAKGIALDGDEKLAGDYLWVTRTLEAQGLAQYEVSNFAREGRRSRHNMAYWQGRDYIGLGMGAHGLDGRRRYWNQATLSGYIDAVARQGHAVAGEEILTAQTRLTEDLIFGLRTNDGIEARQLEARHGRCLLPAQTAALEGLLAEGFLKRGGARIRTTLKGRLILDEIAVRLV